MTMSSRANALVFASAYIGMLLFGITLITLGSVAPAIQQRFNLDGVASGALFSVLPIGIVMGSLFFGPFADRYGYKIILLICCVAIFVGFEGIANASSLMVLKICVFFFGFGGGAINGATNALVSDISKGNKSANLSLLGVFFAIGALGVPLLLGVLENHVAAESIITTISYFTLLCAAFFLLVSFPKPKQSDGIAFNKITNLLKDRFLWLVTFFLFFQTGFEGIINNWTTLYLTIRSSLDMKSALFALSSYVAGMAVMRLILGALLRAVATRTILLFSIALLVAGNLLLTYSIAHSISVTGLVLIGGGLAAGFPVMLGFAGTRYADVSGTAFSLIISIALLGNVILNYTMGIIVEAFGIQHMTKLTFTITLLMFIFSILVVKNFETKFQRK